MTAVHSLESRVRERLAELNAQGLLRTLWPPRGIDLSSNDYLGLAAHPLLKEQMMRAVAEEGCGSTGSRLLRGQRDSTAAVERRFAEFKGTEKSLYFATGYMANLAVLTTFPEGGDVVYSDAANHASLIDGLRLSRARRVMFPHNDVSALERLLAEDTNARQKFVVTESLFSMDGDMAPLTEYAALCQSANAVLLVDEAHAVGIYGERGSGLAEAHGVDDSVCLSINPAGKALGVAGAFVAGPAWVVDYLIQRARPFIFSTAPPPPVAAALDASLTVVSTERDRRDRLVSRARYLRERLVDAGINLPGETSQIIPIRIGENRRTVATATALQRRGFDVRAIRPPTVPSGTARLRVCVNASLSEATLDGFVAALKESLREVDSCSAVSS